MRAFFYHYNKPASTKAGKPMLTVHYADVCHLVRAVVCKVPTATRERRSQPRIVVAGRGVVRVVNETAFITAS